MPREIHYDPDALKKNIERIDQTIALLKKEIEKLEQEKAELRFLLFKELERKKEKN